jgi:hypothetical protein
MIYWNQAGQRVKKTVDTIVSKIVANELSQDAVDNALRRVMEVKDRHNLRSRPLPRPADAEKLGKKRIYPKEALEVERRSVTLAQNRDGLLPLRKASLPVSVTGVVGVEILANALEEYYKFVPRQRIASARHGNDIFDFEIDRITSHLLGIRTMIIIVTPEVRLSSQLKLISALQAKDIRVIAVLLGYPDTLPRLAGVDAIVLAYCDPAAPNVALLAVADVLAGRGPLGTMPVVPDVKARAGEMKRFNALDVVRAPAGQLPVDIEAPYVAGLAVPYDPTETIKKVQWDFGDGKKAKGLVVERAYASAGRYPVTLTVTDKKGQVTKRTFYALVE